MIRERRLRAFLFLAVLLSPLFCSCFGFPALVTPKHALRSASERSSFQEMSNLLWKNINSSPSQYPIRRKFLSVTSAFAPSTDSIPDISNEFPAYKNDIRPISSPDELLKIFKKLRLRPWSLEDVGQNLDISTRQGLNFALRQLTCTKYARALPYAFSIFNYMMEQSRNENMKLLKPDIMTLNILLDVCSKSPSSTSASKLEVANSAQRLFDLWTNEWYPNGLVLDDVDRISYNTLISCYGKAGHPERAQGMFDALQARFQGTKDESFRPDQFSYGSLLHSYAAAGQVDTVMSLFQNWMQQKNQAPMDTPLSIHALNVVLHAYSKSNYPEQALEFLSWWRTSNALSNDQTILNPDTYSYNIALHALAQMSGNSTIQSSSIVERAEQLFDAIPRPDAVSYFTLASVYSCMPSDRRFQDKIEQLIKQAVKNQDENENATGVIQVDANFLSNILYTVANYRGRPRSKSYLVDDGDGEGDSINYGSKRIINMTMSMPRFADALVQEYLVARGLSLNLRLYNALLYCWASAPSSSYHTDYDVAKRTLQLLNQMENDESIVPNAKTYTNVLTALSKSASANRNAVVTAESLVKSMENFNSTRLSGRKQYNRGPRRAMRPPNLQIYSALIQVYARSKNIPNKAVKAAQVLKRMKEAGITPNIIAYNSVLNACEYTDPSNPVVAEEALKVAFLTFDEIRSASPRRRGQELQNIKPDNDDQAGGYGVAVSKTQANHVTYAAFLGVLANLMSLEARQELVQLAVRRCQMEGQVSPLVLRKLWDAVEEDETRFSELLRGHTDFASLPASWTANVRYARAREYQ